MKNLRTSGIYKIVNTINGKIYVGSAVNLHARWIAHKTKLNNDCHHSIKLQNAWKKYGENCFEFDVLEFVADRNDLIKREQYWIDSFCSAGRSGYNINPTAGSPLGQKHSIETIEKRRISRDGYRHSDETKRQISIAASGRRHTHESKEKMRIAAKKRLEAPGELDRLKNLRSGVPNSIESNILRSITLKGKKKTAGGSNASK